MDAPLRFPFYAKISLIIIGTYAFVNILYVGQSILLPVIYATIIAIVLNPMVNFLTSKKLNRIVAISIVLLLAILATSLLIYFLTSQVSMFSEAFPKLKDSFNKMFQQVIDWMSGTFNMTPQKINDWINTTKSRVVNNNSAVIGRTVTTIGGILAVIFLIPVYVFMILYYKPLLLEFIRKLFGRTNQEQVAEVLIETRTIIQSYLAGLLVEAAIVAALNSAGLLILGIKYAILMGIIGALLNVIPYLGGIIATALPMIMALVTKSPTYSLLVLGVYLLIQFVDNHYIIPKIVASKVKINALISVIVVFIGGSLWGIPGMFLSIPLTAIFKIVFDHIDSLKAWGFLLGDTMPRFTGFKFKALVEKSKNK